MDPSKLTSQTVRNLISLHSKKLELQALVAEIDRLIAFARKFEPQESSPAVKEEICQDSVPCTESSANLP